MVLLKAFGGLEEESRLAAAASSWSLSVSDSSSPAVDGSGDPMGAAILWPWFRRSGVAALSSLLFLGRVALGRVAPGRVAPGRVIPGRAAFSFLYSAVVKFWSFSDILTFSL